MLNISYNRKTDWFEATPVIFKTLHFFVTVLTKKLQLS